MAWTATVQSAEHTNGNLLIGVSYTNGIQTFTESMNMNGSTQTIITNAVQNRLNTLNQNDSVVTSITPTVKAGTFTVISSVQAISLT